MLVVHDAEPVQALWRKTWVTLRRIQDHVLDPSCFPINREGSKSHRLSHYSC